MGEREQILYMQIRLLQMAVERWERPRDEVARLFGKYGLAKLIETCFDIYHTEGDECVYEDIMTLLRNKGALKHGHVE